jgi:hypothetical protein
MDSSTATAKLVYAAIAYTATYAIFLLVKATGTFGTHGYPGAPYDTSRLILKGRYV